MTSLIGGTFSDVLHSALASQLMTSSAQNSQKTSGTTSDSETSIYNAENGNPTVTLDLFKDGLFAALHPPPADVANSDTASSESPEPSAHQNHSENDNLDEHQSAALSLIQSFGTPIDVTSSSATSSADAFFSEATIRDLMPVLAAANGGGHTMSANSTTMMTSSSGGANGANSTSSPSAWARNAGRKKSHPVWDFFKDMKDTTGTGGVICLHCTWTGDDRSPNNLRTHLKKFHTDDGIFNRFSEKLAKTPTQPYVKRVRGGGSSAASSSNSQLPSMVKMEQKPMLDSMAFLQQLQQSGGLNESDFQFNAQNFLDSLPKSSEVINCNSGLNGGGEHDMEDGENHHVEAASSSSSDEPVPQAESPEHNQQHAEQNDQLAAFVSSLTSSNPMMFAMLNAAGSTAAASTAQNTQNAAQNSTGAESPVPETCESPKDPSSFSLSEGHCAAQLMSMALDLEMTMSYHRRRVDIELCFESNRTAEKSGGRGKVICLTDLGKEIRITERVNGAVCDTELWTKTDFNQFHWAIRGKCQKCFNKQ